MIKIKLLYNTDKEKEDFIKNVKDTYRVLDVSKELCTGTHKRIHIKAVEK
jgi:hypothetical protein